MKATPPPRPGRSTQPRSIGLAGASRGGRPRGKSSRRDRLILIAIIIIAALFILRRTTRLARMGRVTNSHALAAAVAPSNAAIPPPGAGRALG